MDTKAKGLLFDSIFCSIVLLVYPLTFFIFVIKKVQTISRKCVEFRQSQRFPTQDKELKKHA